MARAYDLVMGRKKDLSTVDPQGESAKAATDQTVLEETEITEARISLRLSEIDILKLKTGTQPEITDTIESDERIVVEHPQGAINGETVHIESPERIDTQPLLQAQHIQPQAAEPKRLDGEEGIRGMYVAAKQYMANIRSAVRKGESFQLEPALTYINNVIQSTDDMTAQIYQLTVDYEKEDDYYLSSPINTLVYGLKIAQRMGYTESKLIEFGLAALLHDIGMFRIPDEILNKAGRPSESEMNLIKSHPEFAVEILNPFAAKYPKMIRAVYEHQERANGQGYPRGLKGEDICDYAQIIGICDSYEAMTHHRPHKKPLLQADSIKELISSKAKLFEPRITKMFLDEISIYPIGSYVRLNNRNIGRVVATNKNNPMKPVVNLIFDEKGIKMDPPRMVDLRSHPVLNIEDSVSFEDLPT